MSTVNQLAIHARVVGRVQGVWFRQSTKEQAQALGLSGWVRNLHNGDVEVWAQGAPQQVRHLETWLAKGPELAKVAEVQVVLAEWDPTCQGFVVLADAQG
ncbi:acylphosphatase [Balneatrix alpica]|uniref:acylphosphatase n=1 Tax=Balneatrix alpica TaxID=75684 RepID=UPI002738D866|nr:acylphosphatase [Balneatrix alpica]